MSSEALDEEGHGDDEADAHEEDAVPIGLRKTNFFAVPKKGLFFNFQILSHRNPLSDGKEGVLVEQKVLQSYQGTLCVNL